MHVKYGVGFHVEQNKKKENNNNNNQKRKVCEQNWNFEERLTTQ